MIRRFYFFQSLYGNVLLSKLFYCNGELVMQCISKEDESWSKGEPVRFLWSDLNGTELGTAELSLRPEDFRLMQDRQNSEEKGVYRYPVLGINQLIQMEDGLWAYATIYIAEKRDGDDGFYYPSDEQEYVLIRIPEYKQP